MQEGYFVKMSKKLKIFLCVMTVFFVITLTISIILSIKLINIKSSIQNSYLNSYEYIYIMEAGILKNNLVFEDGKDITFKYDFNNEDYSELIEKYDLKRIAGEGTVFERALRLMNEFAPRLIHSSNYNNRIRIRALPLLRYSLDNKKNGINCRNKAQILNEMYLALSIYSRKVWIMPNSPYDTECHVVNEIWDANMNKWIMIDITNNQYWIDENKTPLSITEIRTNGALQKFCTPVNPNDDLSDLKKLKEKNMASFVYIMKNMAYMKYCSEYGAGEGNVEYLLRPVNSDVNGKTIISEKSIIKSPYEK